MPMPTLLVEFQAPGSATWNNITSYVASVNIDRGGDRDISEVSAGSCSVVLFNRTRQFDPKYSSGYYTAIRPVGKVRVSSQGNLRFFGYITAWDYTYDLEGNSFAIMSASDGLSELGKKSLIEYTPPPQLSGIRIDNVLSRPEVNWPSAQRNLEAGSTLYNYPVTGGTNALTYIQQCVSSEGGLFFADRQGKLTYLDTGSTGGTFTSTRTNLMLNPSVETNATGYYTGLRNTLRAKFGTYSMYGSSAGSGIYTVAYTQPGLGNSAKYTLSLWIYCEDTNYRDYRLTANCYTSGGASLISSTSQVFTLKGTGWQQIGVTFTGGGSLWTGTDSFEFIITADATALDFSIDGVLLEQTEGVYDYFDGSVVPTGNTYTTYSSVWNGTAHASTSTLTITSTFSNITTGSFSVSDVSGIRYIGIEMAYGAETLYNRVVVDWPWRTEGQLPIIVNDSTSQNTYGIKTLELSENLLVDNTSRTNRANAALTAFKDPEFRINSVTVQQQALTSAQQTTLSTQDIGSTCNVTFTPNGVGTSITPTAYTVIGISESITPDSYETTYYLSASGSLGRVGGVSLPE